jgi:NAD+--asparagine ADP-ribosyltransferase
MNNFFCIILLIYLNSIIAQEKSISVKLEQYIPICKNGVREVNKNPKSSVRYKNKTLIVKSEDNIDSVKTDKNGYLKTKWKYGTYYLYEPWKYYKLIPKEFSQKNIDKICLENEWAKEDLKIVVSKKTTTVANNIILLKCPDEFPCLMKNANQ